MTKVFFEVDARSPVKLYEKPLAQQPQRAAHGETGFSMHVDDNARHVSYVLLDWESLASAHKFLASPASHELTSEWPIEKIVGAIPLKDFAESYTRLFEPKSDA